MRGESDHGIDRVLEDLNACAIRYRYSVGRRPFGVVGKTGAALDRMRWRLAFKRLLYETSRSYNGNDWDVCHHIRRSTVALAVVVLSAQIFS